MHPVPLVHRYRGGGEAGVTAVFRIKQTLELRSGGMLMIVGEIVSGVIRVGDRISGLGREIPIAAVGNLTRVDRSCDVTVGVRYTDEGDLGRLKGFATTGRELIISTTG